MPRLPLLCALIAGCLRSAGTAPDDAGRLRGELGLPPTLACTSTSDWGGTMQREGLAVTLDCAVGDFDPAWTAGPPPEAVLGKLGVLAAGMAEAEAHACTAFTLRTPNTNDFVPNPCAPLPPDTLRIRLAVRDGDRIRAVEKAWY